MINLFSLLFPPLQVARDHVSLIDAFASLDKDKDGYLSLSELTSAFKGKEALGLTTEEVRSLNRTYVMVLVYLVGCT